MKKAKDKKIKQEFDLSESKISRWESLKNRLESGTLLKALRGSITRHGRGGSTGSSLGSGVGLKPKKYSSGSTGTGGGKFNAKMLILEAKSLHDAAKKKQQERSERRRLLKKQTKLEKQLEYLNFPTIMGWYFDGFFTPHFQLNEEYAVIFNELEQEVAQKKETAYKETFSEMAKRNFWPPRLIGGFMFRTKGVYLDFKEILKDPPHTPPDIVTDPRTKAVTLFVNDQGMEDTDSKVPSAESIPTPKSVIKMTESQYDHVMVHPPKRLSKMTYKEQLMEEMKMKYTYKDAFYFDDTIPGFFRKNPAHKDKYYFDSQFSVWRVKRNPVTFANDFYFDDKRGIFLAKDRTLSKDAYLFYPDDGCYRESGEVGPTNWRGLTPKSFYWDEKLWKWNRIKQAPNNVKIILDDNANRHCLKNPKAKTPDDYYFDTVNQTFVLKQVGKGKDYKYDWAFGAWRKKSDPEPQKQAINPNNFYWNETNFSFLKKDAPSAFFVFDTNNRFFRKKKSVRGMYHPKNWNWNEKKKTWELKRSTQSRFFTESLYWRPDRDYDKPWLEYSGGYGKYRQAVQNNRNYYDDDDDQGENRITASASEPIKPGNRLSESSVKSVKKDPPVKEPTKPVVKSAAATLKEATILDSEGKPVPNSVEEALRIADLFEGKVLKIRNLGVVVTDADIKAYFASVYKVTRPNLPGTSLTQDFAYLFFKTEEAAEAALRTMHNKVIKGQTIALQYKLKEEDAGTGEKVKVKKRTME